MGISIWQVIILGGVAGVIAFSVWLNIRILNKAGYSGWWSIVLFIPLVNIIMIWVFAFSKWPKLNRSPDSDVKIEKVNQSQNFPISIPTSIDSKNTAPGFSEPKRDSIDYRNFHRENGNMEIQNIDQETPDFFEFAWDELSNGTIQKGIWARAYSETEGDEQKAKSIYIKLRVPQLEAEYTEELTRKQTEERERLIREEHDRRIMEEDLSRSQNMAKHGLLVCSVDSDCNELGIKPGDVIIFHNGIDVRNNKLLFLRQLESATSSEKNILGIVREKQFFYLTVRGGKLGIQVSQLV